MKFDKLSHHEQPFTCHSREFNSFAISSIFERKWFQQSRPEFLSYFNECTRLNVMTFISDVILQSKLSSMILQPGF